jgi:hypothetical protein
MVLIACAGVSRHGDQPYSSRVVFDVMSYSTVKVLLPKEFLDLC